MLSKFRRVLRVFRSTHISFRFPKQIDIVQIHNDGIEILAQYVNRSSISVVDPSTLNFWILLKCISLAKFQMQGYAVEVIKSQRPRVVITFIDNDTNFFLLKQLVPSPVYIAVQNGLRHNYAYAYGDGFVDRLINAGGKNRLSADVICTFGKSSSALFEDNIRASTLVVGSLKNNLVQVSAPENLEYDIVFMSQHAPFDLTNREETIYLNQSSVSLHEFYEIESDLKRAKQDQLETIITILPWIAQIDEFQHWVYENPSHSIKERKEKWIQLSESYSAGLTDWQGFEEVRENSWQKQMHLFEVPFYYIEYGIAQLGALSIWKNSIQNEEEALSAYKQALSLGYTTSIPEIYKTAGVSFDFSEAYISELMEFVELELSKV